MRFVKVKRQDTERYFGNLKLVYSLFNVCEIEGNTLTFYQIYNVTEVWNSAETLQPVL